MLAAVAVAHTMAHLQLLGRLAVMEAVVKEAAQLVPQLLPP
jgi:hypothetical protein